MIEDCRRILRSLKDYEYVESAEDFDLLISIFSLAPYWELKTRGQEIARIQRRPTGIYGSSGFYLIRTDGSNTDISFNKIFRKDPVFDDIAKALRQTIEPVISEFRKQFKPFTYGDRCISSVEEVDVDHYDKPFRVLVDMWLDLQGGADFVAGKINDTVDGSTITCLTDKVLADDFVAFHNANTHLRFLPKDINRSRKDNKV